MYSKFLPSEVNCLIENFIGPNYWKIYFSSTVLPSIDKKWKLVGNMEGTPCLNCYCYGNGIDVGCNNNPLICNSDMSIWMSISDYNSEIITSDIED